MARRKQKALFNLRTPEEFIACLIIGAPIILWFYISEHPLQGMLIIIAIVGIVFFLIVNAKKKRAAYLRWFYDRSRRIEELNSNKYIDPARTDAIEEAQKNGKAVEIGRENYSFEELRKAYGRIYESMEQLPQKGSTITNTESQALLGQYGVQAKCQPLILRTITENNGGYVFYVFPETVLAFVEGPEKIVFLAAYQPDALKVEFKKGGLDRAVVVQEKTQNHIRYYDKFNPIPDAQIIKSEWRVTNKDGSRSFKGGLLPENNPLTFRLLFGHLCLKFGDFYAEMAFSRARAVQDFVEQMSGNALSGFGRSRSIEADGRNNEGEVIGTRNETARLASWGSQTTKSEIYGEKSDSIYSRTSAVLEEKLVMLESAEEPEGVRNEQPRVQEGNKKAELTEEEARYRNREIAKAISDALNKIYKGKYEFKVYQVRKPREGWALQDAGVYTYKKDAQGIEYTIEFDLHTNIDIPKTDLKFSIWSKKKENVLSKYKNTVIKGKMREDGEGYSNTISRDYESMGTDGMKKQCAKDIYTLMKLIGMDEV